jgi:hypothetical protein
MSEDDLHRQAADPECPMTYEDLWDMLLAPRGQSILEVIEEYERKLTTEPENGR